MKKTLIVFGLTSGITALVFAVTKFSKFAIIPIVVAFATGLIILFISRKQHIKMKSIQYIFLMVIIALGFTIYKSMFSTTVINTDEQPINTTKTDIKNEKKLEPTEVTKD
jgi:energy-coupling factor transporter transmembrane protein EcfT